MKKIVKEPMLVLMNSESVRNNIIMIHNFIINKNMCCWMIVEKYRFHM